MAKKILVADDEAHILHVVSLKLRNAGFEVLTAVDGEEAAELCLAELPDLLITDFQMPYLTGLDLCRQLRQAPATKSIPAIMLTARGFDIEPAEMAEAGIAAVLAKPFSPRELLECVNSLLKAPPVATGSPETAGDPARQAAANNTETSGNPTRQDRFAEAAASVRASAPDPGTSDGQAVQALAESK
jgi:DNA-binding response OmpR family regulator